MRKTFAAELGKMMKDGNTFLLSGDLGFSVFEDIKEKHADRYINMGVAEQNMLGVAAGMALAGKNVFVYSIIPFLLYRPFEQLRNDICYQNLPVRLVGVGAGFSYSDAGFTHHSIEDYGTLKSLPNISILSPADPKEVSSLMQQVSKVEGPVYLRLSRNGEPILHDKHEKLKIGTALEISNGSDILFISTGSILGLALKVAKMLNDLGHSTQILNYHTIKPFDEQSLLRNAIDKKLIVTLEEHVIETGIYSNVVQSLSKNGISVKVIPFGVGEPYVHESGTREYMLDRYGMEPTFMLDKIKKQLER